MLLLKCRISNWHEVQLMRVSASLPNLQRVSDGARAWRRITSTSSSKPSRVATPDEHVQFGGLAPPLSATLTTQHQRRTGLRTGFTREQQKNGWCVIDCTPEAEPGGQRNPPGVDWRHIAKIHQHGTEASIVQNQIGCLQGLFQSCPGILLFVQRMSRQ